MNSKARKKGRDEHLDSKTGWNFIWSLWRMKKKIKKGKVLK